GTKCDTKPDVGRAVELFLPPSLEGVGGPLDPVVTAHAVHPYEKLLPAPAGDYVLAAESPPQHFPEPVQHLIAGRVTVTVIHPLEVIEVQYGEAQGLPLAVG